MHLIFVRFVSICWRLTDGNAAILGMSISTLPPSSQSPATNTFGWLCGVRALWGLDEVGWDGGRDGLGALCLLLHFMPWLNLWSAPWPPAPGPLMTHYSHHVSSYVTVIWYTQTIGWSFSISFRCFGWNITICADDIWTRIQPLLFIGISIREGSKPYAFVQRTTCFCISMCIVLGSVVVTYIIE